MRKILIKLVRNPLGWKLLRPFARFGSFLIHQRRIFEHDAYRSRQDLSDSFSSNIVLHGPFRGMRYPEQLATGSSFLPKLLGSYEAELHKVIEEFCAARWETIIDVGCAEGYYAVGMGLRQPQATIKAYDLDDHARRMCRSISDLNGISDRLTIGKTFTPDSILQGSFEKETLLISDCEGYEKKLFTSKTIPKLQHCTLLIETHDFIDIGISTALGELFAQTHEVEWIKSRDDIQKAKYYDYPELDEMDLQSKEQIYHEGRPAIMEWMVCRPKRNGHHAN